MKEFSNKSIDDCKKEFRGLIKDWAFAENEVITAKQKIDRTKKSLVSLRNEWETLGYGELPEDIKLLLLLM